VTPRVLSRELKELQLRGLIHRRQYDVVPPKVEYSLTELGRGLVPILEAIVDWGLTGVHEEILGTEITPSKPTKAPTKSVGSAVHSTHAKRQQT
jgi:DNA-binding HxlR family transcriptional regulator